MPPVTIIAPTDKQADLARELETYVIARISHHGLSLIEAIGVMARVRHKLRSTAFVAMARGQQGRLAIPAPGTKVERTDEPRKE